MANTLSKAILIAILILASAGLRAQEIGQQIEIFSGGWETQHVRIKILRIGEPEKEEVLIQISGIDDPINNHIYKYKKEWLNSDKRLNLYAYVTHDIPGHKRYAAFYSEHNGYGPLYKVFVSAMPLTPIYVLPEEYSENLDPVFMYNQYLDQQKSGQRVK